MRKFRDRRPRPEHEICIGICSAIAANLSFFANFSASDASNLIMFPDQPDKLEVSRRIRIPYREFQWSVARSSGPGGQNVNKVNSKVVLRWNLTESNSIAPDLRERFIAAYRRRITNEGELVISSERFRDQPKNVTDCLDKLCGLLLTVAEPPKPRRAVKPTRASKRRRVAEKRERAETKARRRPPKFDA